MKFVLSHAVVGLSLLLFAIGAQSAQITIVTSFPKELTEVYKNAFEKTHPDIKVEIVNKSTSASLKLVKESAMGQRPDIFWASAPDAFETMARQNLLEKAPEVKNPGVPPKVGKYPMNDPEGFYYGQALSGYGIMWNKAYLKARNLPAPRQWSDLTKPSYFGHVAMSSPARSGTTHLTVETILQGEGWDKGWSQVMQIAGNCAEITERSIGVPEGVNKGQFGIGLVIDYFGLSGKYSGFPVDFAYPKMTAVVPASIALIAGAKNTADAKKFIAFALSRKGQELMLDSKISRVPVMPYGDLLDSVPGTYPNIFGIARRSQVTFDSNLAQARHAVVIALFDQAVTFSLKELQAATKAIHEAEQRLAAKPHARAASMVKKARELAFQPLITAQMVGNRNLLSQWTDDGKATNADKSLISREEKLNAKARENYLGAVELAQEALALVK